MSVAARLVAFAAVLALAFGGAALAGSALDPTQERVATAEAGPGEASAAHGGGHGRHAAAAEASGLAVSEDGYALEVDRTAFSAGTRTAFRFRITDERGRAVTDAFERQHDRELHLIVVRRDTARFQHVHPRKGADGTWSIDLTLPAAGVYRAYADVKIGGKQRTLATDLFAAGEFRPEPLPAPAAADRTGDLTVALSAPRVRAGREAELAFAVTRGGAPFTALEPYLGAKGHLVALREGDLAYLHVHPVEGGDAGHEHADGARSSQAHGNEVRFAATFPTAGRYRLFLQVKTGGRVRTVAYTVDVPR